MTSRFAAGIRQFVSSAGWLAGWRDVLGDVRSGRAGPDLGQGKVKVGRRRRRGERGREGKQRTKGLREVSGGPEDERKEREFTWK